MLMPALISLLIGSVLGQHFKVLILYPIFLATLFLAASVAMARPDADWTAGLTVVVVIVGLQIGYLVGIGIWCLLEGRASRLPSSSLPNSLPPQHSVH